MNKQGHNSTAVIFLKIASVITFVWAIGHTYGTFAMLSGSSKTSLETLIITIEGANVSIADLFEGYGLFITAYMLMQSFLLWILATLSKTIPVNNFVLVFLIANIVTAIFSQMYLIFIPVIFSTIISILLILFLLKNRK